MSQSNIKKHFTKTKGGERYGIGSNSPKDKLAIALFTLIFFFILEGTIQNQKLQHIGQIIKLLIICFLKKKPYNKLKSKSYGKTIRVGKREFYLKNDEVMLLF